MKCAWSWAFISKGLEMKFKFALILNVICIGVLLNMQNFKLTGTWREQIITYQRYFIYHLIGKC